MSDCVVFDDFDWELYVKENNLTKLCKTKQTAWNHFRLKGQKSGLKYKSNNINNNINDNTTSICQNMLDFYSFNIKYIPNISVKEITNSIIKKILLDDYSINKTNYLYYKKFLDGFYTNCLNITNEFVIKKRTTNMNNIRNYLQINIINNLDYKIPFITHKIWITGDDNPYEITIERLYMYIDTIYMLGPNFKHMFWCVNKQKIPNMINFLQQYDNIEIHEISELSDIMYGTDIYNSLIYEKRYTAASDVLRFNLIYLYGGIYSDFGVILNYNIIPLLKLDYVFGQEGYMLGPGFMAAKPKSLILFKICEFIENLDRISVYTRNISNDIIVPPWTSLGLLTVICDFFLDTDKELLLACQYNKHIVNVNNMASWLQSDTTKSYGQPNFYINPISLNTYFKHRYTALYSFDLNKDSWLKYCIYFYKYYIPNSENPSLELSNYRKNIMTISNNIYYKDNFIRNNDIPIIYHTCLLTSSNNSWVLNEIQLEFIEKTIKSLNKGIIQNEVWFWHNYNSIPDNLLELQTKYSCIKLKHINELIDNNYFYGKDIFFAFLNDTRYANANDILRMNIIYYYGGLYTDMMVNIKYDINNILNDYNYGFFNNKFNNIDNSIIYAKYKNSSLIKDYLNNIDEQGNNNFDISYFKTPEEELTITDSHFLMYLIDTKYNNESIFFFKNDEFINLQDDEENYINKSNIPDKNIVISSTQYPGYGGAATNAYELIKMFRKTGYNVVGIFFHNRPSVNYDPDNIGGIFLYGYEYGYDNKNHNKVYSEAINYLNGSPDICLCKNYMAPLYCKSIFNCYTVYLVSGINHFGPFYKNLSAKDVLDPSFVVNEIIKDEINTNNVVDKIIVNSKLTYDIFKKIYPEFIYKLKSPIDTTICIKKIDYPLEKTNDIIIICSDFLRTNKNNQFLINVIKDTRFDKYKKIIVGENNYIFKNIPNVELYDLQIHTECIKLMCKSKILLFPSLYESNSNTIREAYYHKCLPLITENVGYYELFPKYLICDNFTVEEWINKLEYLLVNYDMISNTEINFNTELDLNYLLN